MANPQGPVVIIYLTMFPRSSKLDNIKGKSDQVNCGQNNSNLKFPVVQFTARDLKNHLHIKSSQLSYSKVVSYSQRKISMEKKQKQTVVFWAWSH